MNRCVFCEAPCGISTVADAYPHASQYTGNAAFLTRSACADAKGCARRMLEKMSLAPVEVPQETDAAVRWRYGLTVQRPSMLAFIGMVS